MKRIEQNNFGKFIYLSVFIALSLMLTWTWTAEAANPGDVVINEIMQNPSAVFDSDGEWFELINTTNNPIDIDGWTIEDNDIDSHVIDNGGPLIIPANGFLVLGNNSDSATNGGVTLSYQFPKTRNPLAGMINGPPLSIT